MSIISLFDPSSGSLFCSEFTLSGHTRKKGSEFRSLLVTKTDILAPVVFTTAGRRVGSLASAFAFKLKMNGSEARSIVEERIEFYLGFPLPTFRVSRVPRLLDKITAAAVLAQRGGSLTTEEWTLRCAPFLRPELTPSEIAKEVLSPEGHEPLQRGEQAQYDLRLFGGWVPQPGRTCAAASVAGVYNALRNIRWSADGASTAQDVLGFFVDAINESTSSKWKTLNKDEATSLLQQPFTLQHPEMDVLDVPFTKYIGNEVIIKVSSSLGVACEKVVSRRFFDSRWKSLCQKSDAIGAMKELMRNWQKRNNKETGLFGFKQVWSEYCKDQIWSCIKQSVGNPKSKSVLLYHMENHYAPIYAFREYEVDSPVSDGHSPQVTGRTRVREIYTAEGTQQPNTWVSLEDVFSIIEGCKGGAYSVMRLQIPSAPRRSSGAPAPQGPKAQRSASAGGSAPSLTIGNGNGAKIVHGR